VSVTVTTAAPDAVVPGNTQGYSYSVGACSTPQNVTLEWVKILDPNAKFDRDPAARQSLTGEISQGTAMSGSGTWTVPASATTGAYAVMVRYYTNYNGVIVNEANANVKFNVKVPDPVDVCLNLAGMQTTVPAGMSLNAGICSIPPVDVCTNLAGMQVAVPEGMTLTEAGICTLKATPQGDPGVARLTLTKVASRKVVSNGQVFTYTLRYKNTGTIAAIKPLLCDTLPAHLTIVKAPGAKFSQGRICWTQPSLAPKASKTITFTVRVDQNTPRSVKRIVNRATVKASNTNRANAQATVTLKHKAAPQPSGGVTG